LGTVSLEATDSGAKRDAPDVSSGDLERLYASLRLIRRVEETVADVYPSDKIKSPVHLSIGQEALSVGVCDVLAENDAVAGSYRGHAAYLAKGGDLPAMMAELFGKVTGCARGKGGSMHMIDMQRHVLGTSAVVGTVVPVAVGYGFALAREGRGRMIACFLGDGATEEGCFYESLNFAALHQLPILFVCENNGLAIHTPVEKRWAAKDLCARVAGFGLRTQRVADGDVVSIRQSAQAATARIRGGEGPEFLECVTHRRREHVGPAEDYDAGYRSREQAQTWLENDQVDRLATLIDQEARTSIDDAVEAQIDQAVAFAESSAFPDAAELTAHVFAR
jgi:pyruvate dehydrogenase E1 component alpha subunit